ncbi:MAG: RNA polymerase factor sigma-54 [Alphaproteobacteria bacterium]
MALNTRLDLRQTQSLVMTPQLQQAIKLLQMSNVEVTQFVDEALEQNPLLERGEGERDGEAPAEGEAGERAEAENADDGGAEREEVPLDIAYEDVWTDSGTTDAADAGGGAYAFSRGAGPATFETDENTIEQTASREKSLREHLLDQLHVDVMEPVDRVIGVHLIDMIDETGYLAGDLGGVAQLLNCSNAQIEATLERLRGFDPPGVFARNLKECLAIQLKERDRLDPSMEKLLDNLDLLGKHDFASLKRACGVDEDDLAEMIAELKALNPKPGLAFDTTVVQAITPDVMMRPDNAGGWIVELNTDTLPRVLVNAHYYARVSRGARTKEEKTYISECFQSASWLVKSLHQRANTILKVASEIVRQQDAFFAHGVQFLKPLVLRDIAAAIAMHESTVSRVTTNKYIATPRGVYELKYFFTSAIPSAGGGASHSAESVRFRIRMLIDAETVDEILSDDRIVEILRGEGVEIARRTVAKYREAMRIPSSVQRRREKMLERRSNRS